MARKKLNQILIQKNKQAGDFQSMSFEIFKMGDKFQKQSSKSVL